MIGSGCKGQNTSFLSPADSNCEKKLSPSVVLLRHLCHKKHITLVCLAQGFPYKWPLEVIWKRDNQTIPHRLSFATEPVQEQGECNFATASRLRVLAEEWYEGHNYSCHVHQGDLEKSDWVKPDQKTATASSFLEVQLSLSAGRFVFLLLGVKSMAFGAVLGIYTVCRKTGL